MSENTRTTNTVTQEPKYRKTLNQEQVAVLRLLYKFRFVSSEQVARYFGKKNSKFVQKRLKILEDQGFIAKRYDKSYKLQGKSAAYYLLPKGARALAADHSGSIHIKRIYKDKDVSEKFITHCLSLVSICLQLKTCYGDNKLKFFTKSHLNYEQYEYFPQPLPDAFIRLEVSNEGEPESREFFLDTYEETTPYFILLRRVKKYMQYAGEGDWEANNDTKLSSILIACETSSTQKRLRRRIAKELRDSYEEVTFATTTRELLLSSSATDGVVWRIVDEGDPNPDPEDEEVVGLEEVL